MNTYYEASIKHEDGREYRLMYSARRSRSALAESIQERFDEIRTVTGVTAWEPALRAGDGYLSSPERGWAIRFSGRTERDVKSQGRELDWVVSAAKEVSR